MISSYFKMAWRVLGRNPFFTAISLFGISFTLAVLMLMVSYLQNIFGPNAPLTNAQSLLFLRQLEQKEVKQDTIWKRDSTLVDGIWKLDSTMQKVDNANWTSRSSFSLDYLKQFFSKEKMTTAENITIINNGTHFDIFQNNKKYNLEAKLVDENYFDIFDFKILEGRLFNKADIEQKSMNLVMTDDLAKDYFGSSENIVGKTIHIENKDFTIIGLVPKARVNNDFVSGDVFIPYTYLDNNNPHGYFGAFVSVIQARNGDIDATRNEIEIITAKIPFLDPSQNDGAKFNNMKVLAYDNMHFNVLYFFYSDDPKESKSKFMWLIGTLLFLFCLVPILNLVNLNVSRIMDRSAEIGVRKAFGAHSSQILTQVVFENLILTIIGGFIGSIISISLMWMINKNGWLDELRLSFNFPIFFISLFLVIFFGIISGLLPAYKIAKSRIVESLKYK